MPIKRFALVLVLLGVMCPVAAGAVETVDLTMPVVKTWIQHPLEQVEDGLVTEYEIPKAQSNKIKIISRPKNKLTNIENAREEVLKQARMYYTNYMINFLQKTQNELLVEVKFIGDPKNHYGYVLEKVVLGPQGFHTITYQASDITNRDEMVAVLNSAKIVQKKIATGAEAIKQGQVKKLIDNYVEALKAKDVKKLSSLFSKNALISTTKVTMGKDDFMAVFKKGLPNISDYTVKYNIKSVKISGSKAIAEVEMEEKFKAMQGQVPMYAKTLNVVEVEKQGNRAVITKITGKEGDVGVTLTVK